MSRAYLWIAAFLGGISATVHAVTLINDIPFRSIAYQITDNSDCYSQPLQSGVLVNGTEDTIQEVEFTPLPSSPPYLCIIVMDLYDLNQTKMIRNIPTNSNCIITVKNASMYDLKTIRVSLTNACM